MLVGDVSVECFETLEAGTTRAIVVAVVKSIRSSPSADLRIASSSLYPLPDPPFLLAWAAWIILPFDTRLSEHCTLVPPSCSRRSPRYVTPPPHHSGIGHNTERSIVPLELITHASQTQIKNLSPLRSSDRRKIADQIIRDYKIEVPQSAPVETSGDDSAPGASNPTAPNLTSIRNALLPEDCLTARFTTTAGPQLREVQGTVYVGTHPGADERILWFRVDHGPGADGRLYPTVYTLWHNPDLVPLLHTPQMVMQKLHGGADLMTPGLANDPPFDERAVKGAVVAVASLNRHTVPLFVGVCEIDISALGEVQDTKGHAVRGLHWEGDELWAWSSSSKPGQPAPEYLEGWDDELEEDEDVGEIEEGVQGLAVGGDDAVQATGGEEASDEAPDVPQEEAPEVEEKEPTTKGESRSIQPECSYTDRLKKLTRLSKRPSSTPSTSSSKIIHLLPTTVYLYPSNHLL